MDMILEFEKNKLCGLVSHQLFNNFGESYNICDYIETTLWRLEKCFKKNKIKYYTNKNGASYFSPFQTDQYAIFLYILSNTVYKQDNNIPLATKIYYLNKVMHSTDLYYELELPDYWGVVHPIGSVLGRASYNNGLVFYQGCTIGESKGHYVLE